MENNGYPVPPAPNYQAPPAGYNDEIKPISPLGYIGYQVLFNIPVLGFIAAIIMAIAAKNKNVKNFALAQIILVVAVIVLYIVLGLIFGLSFTSFLNDLESGY